jgi:hypothetical protein
MCLVVKNKLKRVSEQIKIGKHKGHRKKLRNRELKRAERVKQVVKK